MRRTAFIWAVIIMCSFVISKNKWGYIGFNTSDSLPYSIYLVVRGEEVSREDYAAFFAPNNLFFKPDTVFVKQVSGISGDRVYQNDDIYFVNKRKIGRILHETKNGKLLHPGQIGQLPEDMYFMAGLHERSFDSRYQEIGWIPKDNIIGRAYPIF